MKNRLCLKWSFIASIMSIYILFSTQVLASEEELKNPEIYKKSSPSVALLVTETSLGTGVFVSKNTILTNWHVVGNNKHIVVVLKPYNEGDSISEDDATIGSVVRVNQEKDLALVTVNKTPREVLPLSLASAVDVIIGADVHAIGHPTGETWTYTKGIISQSRKNFQWTTGGHTFTANVIQTQTPINPGNSGGPLLTNEGKLIGINSFKAQGEGLNFAISIDEITTFMNQTSSVFTDKVIAPKNNADTELAFFLEKFLPQFGNKQKLADWSIESENNAIAWSPKMGSSFDGQWTERQGKVFLTANKKVYYKLEGRKIPLPWIIRAHGNKFGIDRIHFFPDSETWGFANSGSDFDIERAILLHPKMKLELMHEITKLGCSEKYYRLSCKDKDDSLLVFASTWGSGGSTDEIILFYGVVPTKQAIVNNINKLTTFFK